MAKKKRRIGAVKNNCDKLARKVILLRDVVCQRCGGSINLQCCHVKVRQFNVTRWDLLNLILLCSSDPTTGHYGCHQWFDINIVEGMRWFEETYPARADHLADIEANWDKRNKKLYVSDFEDIEQYLKDKIIDLK